VAVEGYPLKKDYTWEPIENLYGHEELVETHQQWLKTENERLTVRKKSKTVRKLTAQKVQDASADKFRKDDKLRKSKGTKNTEAALCLRHVLLSVASSHERVLSVYEALEMTSLTPTSVCVFTEDRVPP